MRPTFLIGCSYQSNKKKKKGNCYPNSKIAGLMLTVGMRCKPNTTTRIDKRNFWELTLFWTRTCESDQGSQDSETGEGEGKQGTYLCRELRTRLPAGGTAPSLQPWNASRSKRQEVCKTDEAKEGPVHFQGFLGPEAMMLPGEQMWVTQEK